MSTGAPPAPTPVHPALYAALTRKQKTIRWSLVLGGAAALAIVALIILVAEAGIGVLPLAILLALLPLPYYVAFALWIDRYEPEPRWLLTVIFLWGALVSFVIAIILNSLGSLIVGASLGGEAGDIYGSSISAPVVEEAAKGAVLLLIYRKWRHLFNGPLDGLVYGLLVGLGFAATENVLYYGRGALQHGVDGALDLFVLRGVQSSFLHPLFTAMTGLGLGLAARATTKRMKTGAPLAGYAAAVGLHSLWNTLAGTGVSIEFMVTLFLPTVAAVIAVAIVAMRREGRVIRDYLPPEVLPPPDAERLYSVRTRLRDSLEAFQKGGVRGLRTREDYVRAVSEVAFQRFREAQAIRPAAVTTAEVERDYGDKLRSFLEELVRAGPPDAAPVAAAAAATSPLPAAVPPAPPSGLDPGKVCPTCAATVRTVARFCGYCGHRF